NDQCPNARVSNRPLWHGICPLVSCGQAEDYSMQVTVTTFTVAEYCAQMQATTIIVNRDYQRTETVWPPPARTFLIDTILNGYPMPKISLRQITDRERKHTTKEIVDGQQRSRAIFDFWSDKLRITGKRNCIWLP